MTSRRRFMVAAGATAAGTLVGCALPQAIAAAVPERAADLEIDMVARPDEAAVLAGRRTTVWRYEAKVARGDAGAVQSLPGSYVGPVLRVRKGERVRVHFLNRLPEATTIHWHGMLVPDRMDGHPRDAVPPGGRYVYEFDVLNRAGTYWFHPHPHGRTAPQVYAGLAGLLIVSDEEEGAFKLPQAERDIALVITDRTFDAANQLVYLDGNGGMMGGMMGFMGDRILTNGAEDVRFRVANAAHRVRLLNGSNARIYRVTRSDGKPLVVIASDGGLLARPQEQAAVVLSPAERAELWLDFHDISTGGQVALVAEPLDALTAGGMGGGMMGGGMMGGGMRGRAPRIGPRTVCVFDVERKATIRDRLPDRLAALPAADSQAGLRARRFDLAMQRMAWTINGRVFGMHEVADDERVKHGDSEIWVFTNRAGMMAMPHPVHIHGVQFRVLRREGAPPQSAGVARELVESGYKDTVLVLPGERVHLLVTYAAHRGLFLYHCHNLEHEDMGMMRNFEIV